MPSERTITTSQVLYALGALVMAFVTGMYWPDIRRDKAEQKQDHEALLLMRQDLETIKGLLSRAVLVQPGIPTRHRGWDDYWPSPVTTNEPPAVPFLKGITPP